MKSIRLPLLVIICMVALMVRCTKESDCQTDSSKRRGAKCKDGTESSATGSGACSSHGGVDYWLCK